MIKLIGLHGRYHSGKDTAYEVVDQYANAAGKFAMRRAYADAMKISLMRTLGLTQWSTDDFDGQVTALANRIKETGRVTTSWVAEDGNLNCITINGRQLLQLYGTEAHRASDLGWSFSDDFWVNNLLPYGMDGRFPAWWMNFREGWAGWADYAVVTDVRYVNEAERVLACGGEVWYIDVEERLGLGHDEHSSEQKLPDELITRTIDNNGTPEQFENNVLDALEEMDAKYAAPDD